jgi:transposase-like protein
MERKRTNYKPEEKVAILKLHLVDMVPVSDLCDEYSIQGAGKSLTISTLK